MTVRGKLTLADGSPAAKVKVGLMRVPDVGEVFFQGLVVAGTFGAACLSDKPPPVCKIVQSTRTDADGGYVFRMRGSDVQGTFGQASYFHLGAVAPGRDGQQGPSIDTSFVIQREELTVPTMRFWQPEKLSARPGRDHIATDWSPADDIGDERDGYRVHFTVGRPGTADVWQQEAKPGDRVDARAVADLRGAFHVTTYGSAKGPDTTFRTTYASQRTGFRGAAGAPASRGDDCAVRGATGPVALDKCALTDGSYAQSFPQQRCNGGRRSSASPSSGKCAANTWLSVDLGSSKRIDVVFTHGLGLSGDAVIETSDDAERWTERGRTGDEFGTVTLKDATGRYVRLRPAASATAVDRLHELSIWAA